MLSAMYINYVYNRAEEDPFYTHHMNKVPDRVHHKYLKIKALWITYATNKKRGIMIAI